LPREKAGRHQASIDGLADKGAPVLNLGTTLKKATNLCYNTVCKKKKKKKREKKKRVIRVSPKSHNKYIAPNTFQ
jgi:hypothetical protein